MNNYYIDLSVSIPPFADSTVIDKITEDGNIRGTIPIESFNPALIEWLNNKGVSPICSDFFYRLPNDVGPIHTDGLPGDKGKLNWIFGQDEFSIMSWYKNKTGADGEYGIGPHGSAYVVYHEDDLDLMESAVIAGTPSLVNIGVPHRISNGNLRRLCITLHLRDQATDKQPTWARCIDLFRNEITPT